MKAPGNLLKNRKRQHLDSFNFHFENRIITLHLNYYAILGQ
jgi:hypothetical protein